MRLATLVLIVSASFQGMPHEVVAQATRTLPGHKGNVDYVQVGQEWAASAQHGSNVQLWRLPNPDKAFMLEGPKKQLLVNLVMSPTENFLAATYSEETRLWDMSKPGKYSSITGDYSAICISPNGRLVALVDDEGYAIHDIDDPKAPRKKLSRNASAWGFGAFETDSIFVGLVSSGKGETWKFCKWNLRDNSSITSAAFEVNDPLISLCVLPNGNVLLAYLTGKGCIWDFKLSKIKSITLNQGQITPLAWSSGGRYLVYGCEEEVVLLDPRTFKQRSLQSKLIVSTVGYSEKTKSLVVGHGIVLSPNEYKDRTDTLTLRRVEE